MKHFIRTFLLVSLAVSAFAGNSPSNGGGETPGILSPGNFTIDMYDTVVFDISQSVMAANQVSFPVYIITDDTINALDFSLGYDELNFSLDTIINLTAYLQPTYNLNMGTLYFTSYSLQDIGHDTSLVSIRLNMLGHYLCSDDLNSVLVYLNGDPCSVKVVDCLSDKITDPAKGDMHADIYPNPADEILNVVPAENAAVELLDLNTSRVVFKSDGNAGQAMRIATADFAGGIYLLKISNERSVTVRKICIR